MNIQKQPFKMLVRRHEQTESALEEIATGQCAVDKDVARKLSEKEEKLRTERVRRAYNRDGRDAEAETKRVGVVA